MGRVGTARRRSRRLAGFVLGAMALSGFGAMAASASSPSYSVTVTPVTQFIVDAVSATAAAAGVPPPASREEMLSIDALKQMCSATVSRRIYIGHASIPPELAAECSRNGIPELLEARFGFITLVLVQKAGEPRLDLSAKDIYLGLAKRVPHETGFIDNAAKTWRDVDPKKPDTPIHFVLPPQRFAIRDIFEIEALAGGCWHFPVVKDVFLAKDREALCRTMREDMFEEAYTDQERIELLKKAPPGSVAFITLEAYQKNKESLELLAFNGVEATPETLAAEDYVLALPVYLYVNAKDLKNEDGGNALADWIWEALSERALGPSGYLTKSTSLSILPMAEREWQRRSLPR